MVERRDGDPVASATRDSRVKQNHRIDPARHGKNDVLTRAERVAHRGLDEAYFVVAHLCNISRCRRLRGWKQSLCPAILPGGRHHLSGAIAWKRMGRWAHSGWALGSGASISP